MTFPDPNPEPTPKPKPKPKYRPSKSVRIARQRLLYHMQLLRDDDEISPSMLNEIAPRAWHTLEADIDCEEPKEKVTLYLDKSVARTFKAMGRGYQARINRLLATWLQMKAGEVLEFRKSLRDAMHEMMQDGKDAVERGEQVPTA